MGTDTADGYMYINCLWVAGQHKGCGYANELFAACIKDSQSKGKLGLVILSSDKKRPFRNFSDDTAAPYYELYYLPFDLSAPKPRFTIREISKEPGFVLYYSYQCPFTAKYVPLIAETARERNVSFLSVLFETAKEAQNAPVPFATYSLFHDGAFVKNEILLEKKFVRILSEKGLEKFFSGK